MTEETRAVAELSYEQARDELVAVVQRLEQGGATLEESLTLWERGEALAARCEEWLVGAKARLDAARGAASQGHSASEGATSALQARATGGHGTNGPSTAEATAE